MSDMSMDLRDLEIIIRPEVASRSLFRRWRWTIRAVGGPPFLGGGFAVTEGRAKAKADRAVAKLRDYDRRLDEAARRTRTYRP